MAGAVGSTAALNYCFSPYVHALEYLESKKLNQIERNQEDGENNTSREKRLIKATTYNFLSMKVETIFEPSSNVTWHVGHRPFCNFVAKGVPMYVHPELLHDEELQRRLLGENWRGAKQDKTDDDDDDILI